jgi:hypothetical protein
VDQFNRRIASCVDVRDVANVVKAALPSMPMGLQCIIRDFYGANIMTEIKICCMSCHRHLTLNKLGDSHYCRCLYFYIVVFCYFICFLVTLGSLLLCFFHL